MEVAAGSEPAFRSLYNWYAPRLYAVALMYSKSPLTAQDIVQEVFLRIWTMREELPQLSNFGGYIHNSTRNLVISTLRKKLPLLLPDFEKNAVAEEDTWKPAHQLEAKEAATCIKQAVQQLPLRQQQVYQLAKENGLPLKEVAAQLGISYNTAREHMSQALKSIRNYIKNCLFSLLLLISLLLCG